MCEIGEYLSLHAAIVARQNREAHQCGKRNSNGITQPCGAAMPRVCTCEPMCRLLRGRVASLSQRGISSRFWANLSKIPVRRKRSRRKALALFAPMPIHSSPQCELPQGFAGFGNWRFFRGSQNGLTLNLRKVAAKPRVTTVCGGALIENRYALYRCSRRKSP